MAIDPVILNLRSWISDNADHFRPPVGNKELWKEGSQFIFMVSRGPNARNDFHISPSDEIFYQLTGDIRVDYRREDGRTESVTVREGDVFLMPAMVPHCPMRPEGTWGAVIQRVRTEQEPDCLLWYCKSCGDRLYETWFGLEDIEVQVTATIERFNGSAELRTCTNCGAVHDVAEPFVMPQHADAVGGGRRESR
ncbi:3-hydroxyanthranilate 3,4-dioxygenase [Streptomyces tubercidicus]|uniref:3-hydroxyanthranilate 3,4-dioxygenase n=1 Tax=Streptomyces tubercidicus TaxID=47759 RepID=A0A640UR31_9ACTN|nr:3-hydroxyanthranilate 3,4-dioxygenase [Streptomyces tubercidicus]WAU11457.1 3-hydroxyanthranilate 3,4-dioxygenase [Streptomyces tubercidicus]GFE36735.1 3-hydroxyanthranilate 3,4-dioxygenase [Streptomyces tubercidicus]